MCGSAARTDLCGGRRVTSVPTATFVLKISNIRLRYYFNQLVNSAFYPPETEKSTALHPVDRQELNLHWMPALAQALRSGL